MTIFFTQLNPGLIFVTDIWYRCGHCFALDINECSDTRWITEYWKKSLCRGDDTFCLNTNGGYKCGCDEGYIPHPNKLQCKGECDRSPPFLHPKLSGKISEVTVTYGILSLESV